MRDKTCLRSTCTQPQQTSGPAAPGTPPPCPPGAAPSHRRAAQQSKLFQNWRRRPGRPAPGGPLNTTGRARSPPSSPASAWRGSRAGTAARPAPAATGARVSAARPCTLRAAARPRTHALPKHASAGAPCPPPAAPGCARPTCRRQPAPAPARAPARPHPQTRPGSDPPAPRRGAGATAQTRPARSGCPSPGPGPARRGRVSRAAALQYKPAPARGSRGRRACGLPSCSEVCVKSRMSSTTWNARPRWRPYSNIAFFTCARARALLAPRRPWNCGAAGQGRQRARRTPPPRRR